MFGFSFWEFSLLMVVALVVIGPERLPGVARKAGEWTYKVRKFVNNAKAEMDSEFNMQDMKQLLNSQESEISKLRAMVEETRDDLSGTGETVKGALSDAERTMRDSAAGEQARQKDTESPTEDDADAPSRLKAVDEGAETAADRDPFEDELSRLESETGENFHRPFAAPEPDTPAESATIQESTTKGQDEPKERGRDN
ncbi:Sec-independent protein translocase protein TatB [Guyparkeria hydrothermalis]|uniref:Sec-independent protein translocase protein TatB n=1 Tax=Guyparkeria hydrothermalis TaxID=923 RepID=UPI0020206F81|nr:Sec-independent protein translocase protein TatB [Guyparkeria hydrothermalis]